MYFVVKKEIKPEGNSQGSSSDIVSLQPAISNCKCLNLLLHFGDFFSFSEN